MTFFPYINNTPPSGEDPSVSQPDLLTNTQSNDLIWQVDHHGFEDNDGGYHTIIHQKQTPGNVDPAPIIGVNQIYVKTISGDTQLFSMTGGGGISQLTGNNSSNNGFQWLGGILLQWGRITGVGTGISSSDVLFATNNINFPNNLFTLDATPLYLAGDPSSTSSQVTVWVKPIDKTKFRYTINSNSVSTSGFTWIAIGN